MAAGHRIQGVLLYVEIPDRKGEVMALDKNKWNANKITRDYLDSLLVEARHLDAEIPSTGFELFGETFKTPVMTAALSHLDEHLYEGAARDMAIGARDAGAVMWYGMTEEKTIEECVSTGAKVIEIVKPYADRSILWRKLEHARSAGCLAVGIDIDHSFNPQGKADVVEGYEMKPVRTEEVAEICRKIDLPIIMKGVLSLQDAAKCMRAGAAGIVLSHHNNRIPCSVPPLMAIRSIRRMVGNTMEIFVEDEISSGYDVFKALALGAKGVCVGRPLMASLHKEKAEGVRSHIEKMTEELAYMLAVTACKEPGDADESMIYERRF